MKFVLALITLLTAGILLFAADGAPGATYVDHDKVAAAIAKGGGLVTAPDLSVQGSRRDRPGQVEVHEKETDIMYVIDGEATMVTGGTAVGLKQTRPGQSLGSDIQGGETHHLTKGDVIVIPAGVPHWFKEVSPTINCYIVKVIKP
jgi:mannose-6-phosphate isomerase-like protein (cupin superfamily)